MKVLHVYRTFFPESQGGLEETIRQICLSTRESGVESRVFTLSDEVEEGPVFVEGIEVHRVKRHLDLASCSISFSFRQKFRRQYEWADIIHYHFPWPFGDLLHFMQLKPKPSIVTYHSDIVRQKVLKFFYAPVMNRFLDSIDRIVCTSPNYFATSETLVRFQDKVEVVPIGLDPDTYPQTNAESVQRVAEEYGEDFFMFIGVLRYYKGLHILLDAVKGAPFQVVVAGSGPTEKALKAQAEKEGLTNVLFTGSVSDEEKVAMLQACRGIVFPSYLRTEAFGVTLLEGAMFGKPLISTEVGSGTSHVNIHDTTGYVVAPGSAKSLRKAMDRLWYSKDVATQLGKGARQRFNKLFTGSVMGARYAEIYRDMLPPKVEVALDAEATSDEVRVKVVSR